MKVRNKKTGEIGYLIAGRGCDHYFVTNDKWHTCGEYTSLAELNEEWEDYEEPKEYWYIDDAGVLQIDQVLASEINMMRKSIGNYFSSREEAEKAVEKLVAWKRLKDKGFEFTNWEFRDVLDGDLVIEAKLNFDNASNIQRDLEVCFGGEE